MTTKNEKSTVESLHDMGFSYRILSKVSGDSVSTLRHRKPAPAGLLKLGALQNAMESSSTEQDLDAVTIFEEHILLIDENGEKKWAYLHEIWAKGKISDEALVDSISNCSALYPYSALSNDFPLAYNVFEAGDGYKGISCSLPIQKAVLSDLDSVTL